MRVILNVLQMLATLAFAAIALVAGWLYFAPPELIRVGSAYSAKIVCSNVFLAGRDANQVLGEDVQSPGHPLLRLMRVDVDDNSRTVTAGLLGYFGKGTAILRDGLGCTAVTDDNVDAARAIALQPVAAQATSPALWPQGNLVETSNDPSLAEILDDPLLRGPGMRAVVVAQAGRIIGERYGDGFSAETPLLGWSMTKTINAAIIGTLVKAGRMNLKTANLMEGWRGDERAAIKLADLMAMSSGLAFNEDYGDVTDVTRMLFLEPDMAAFAASKPLEGGVGQTFNYSSGTAAILSRLWQEAAGGEALAWPRDALFQPLGMTSAVFETDESGTFAGSSYLYATGRDWVRFGQLLLQDGAWNGTDILPAGFVGWMREPAQAADGDYARGQLWLRAPGGKSGGSLLPADTYWLSGHDGQSMAIVPSRQLVVLRLGLTPSRLGYSPRSLVAAIIDTLP